jgi:catechol 2,3-dioxygenase-like lactoylglutathione lyase family enzyme
MSMTEARTAGAGVPAGAKDVDLKLEVVVIPVSDVERSKKFYEGLGWRLDADFPFDNGFRVVQFTPPGSRCSVQFGTKITSAAPGSAQGLYLIVSDIDRARGELAARGVEISKVFHPGRRVHSSSQTAAIASAGPHLITPRTAPSPPSRTRTGTGGYYRRSRRGCPAESTPTTLSSPPPRISRARCDGPLPLTASTRNEPAGNTTSIGPTGTPRTWSRSAPPPSFPNERYDVIVDGGGSPY